MLQTAIAFMALVASTSAITSNNPFVKLVQTEVDSSVESAPRHYLSTLETFLGADTATKQS